MFEHISEAMRARMRELEEIDQRDRGDGTPKSRRLRQVTPETGRFIALMSACAPEGIQLEVGASAGYSAMWISLALRQLGRRLTTFEIDPAKFALASETFRQAGIADLVTLVEGDARQHIAAYEQIAFCFLDAEKDVYMDCYELLIPRMNAGGLLVADNIISHQNDLQPVIDHALADPRVDAQVLTVGKGQLVCRKK